MHTGRGLEERVVNKAVELLRQHLLLTLFGFDIVVDSITGEGSNLAATMHMWTCYFHVLHGHHYMSHGFDEISYLG